jgi:hypothetical protein
MWARAPGSEVWPEEPEVAGDQGRLHRVECEERAVGVADCEHAEALILQELAEQAGDIGVILDHENELLIVR